MELRAAEVTLDLGHPRAHADNKILVPVFAVLVREAETTPRHETPIEWLLLTSYPVTSFDDAQAVVHGYTQRWRIEEFHRVWKSGACRIEESQLRAREHLVRWAVVAASVAVRIVRITYLARTTPDAPATHEFTDREIQAAVLLVKPASSRTPTLKTVVSWIAQLGGYVGGKNSAPPGPIVLARGLTELQPAVRILEVLDET